MNSTSKNEKVKNDKRRTRRIRPSVEDQDNGTGVGRHADKEEEEETDQRFDASRPQFRRPLTASTATDGTKVVLDERFASVLTDPRFQLTTTDKYGRQSGDTHKVKEQLDVYYTVEESTTKTKVESSDNVTPRDSKLVSSNEREANNDAVQNSAAKHSSSSKGKTTAVRRKEKAKDDDDDDVVDPAANRIAYLTALSRGEIDVSSSSDEDDDDEEHNYVDDEASDDDDTSEDGGPKVVGVLDPSSKEEDYDDENMVERTMEDTPYMAVLNMEWTHVRAVDIFAILSSFTPPGSVRSVQVYPSDFGIQRLQKEELFGPIDVWKKNKNKKMTQVVVEPQNPSDDDDEDDDDDHDDYEDNDDASNESDDENVEHNGGDREYKTQNQHSDSGDPPTISTDFDPEKLRRYEASRLKYYFAVAEFTKAEYADVAYQHVDGMEFEHSSVSMDMRAIPLVSIMDVKRNRTMRDEATSLPSNYIPPEFIVNALQQSTVQCTWDMGDPDRESLLTKYTSGSTWAQTTDREELKLYLASDQSSDDDDDDDDNDDNDSDPRANDESTDNKKATKAKKATNLRKMLGLDDSDTEDSSNNLDDPSRPHQHSRKHEVDPTMSETDDGDESVEDESGEDNDEHDDAEGNKQVSFIPGTSDLATKLRSKIEAAKKSKSEQQDEEAILTPYEKYQEKRKQKRREKRAVAREKRKQIANTRKGVDNASSSQDDNDDDDFFVDKQEDDVARDDNVANKSTSDELGLLFAGDTEDEDARDYNIRALERIEKNKDKKLSGARKRKEEKWMSNHATGGGGDSKLRGDDFAIDTGDVRFRAVLDGTDDRFGIDRTDPNFRETPAMRQILTTQTQNRKAKKQKRN